MKYKIEETYFIKFKDSFLIAKFFQKKSRFFEFINLLNSKLSLKK